MAQTKTKEGQSEVRTRRLEVEIPEGLYNVLEKVCKVKGVSVNEFILDNLIVVLDSELQDNLGEHLGFELKDHDYREDLKDLAYPENAEAV